MRMNISGEQGTGTHLYKRTKKMDDPKKTIRAILRKCTIHNA